MKLCARLGAQRHPAEPSTGTSAPKAGKSAKANKNAKRRNKEMAISRRLEGLRSSRFDHSIQNFMAEVYEPLPRPDSPDLAGQIIKNWGRDRRRRAKSPKAEKLPRVARGSHEVPRGSHGVPHQMLKSVAPTTPPKNNFSFPRRRPGPRCSAPGTGAAAYVYFH